MRTKIQVKLKDFLDAAVASARSEYLKKDKITIEGELVDIPERKFKIGDIVRVNKFFDVFGNEGRVGRVVESNPELNSGCYNICFSRSKNSNHTTPYNPGDLEFHHIREEDFYSDGVI